MTHPSHSKAWQYLDRTYLDFTSYPQNIRLRLCSDGFNSINQFSKPYSCWPMVIIAYNLPPEMIMIVPYLFLTCIIPSLDNPQSKIGIYLQSLIDKLNELWCQGVLTYDISTKQNFMLRVALMWTIKDFPAYGMLFG